MTHDDPAPIDPAFRWPSIHGTAPMMRDAHPSAPGTPPFQHALPPTPVESWWWQALAPEVRSSAAALYDLMSRQRTQLPAVDVPYDPRSESHWAEAARISDYLAHAPASGGWVLDVGPGDGWPALPMAQARQDLLVVGVDPSAVRVRSCHQNAARLGLTNAQFIVSDAAALPVEDARIDLVTAASSLEEAADPPRVFAELARVLRSGGALRASYQDWRLPVASMESILFWEGHLMDEHGGRAVLLLTYVRREQAPPLERRYTMAVPHHGAAEEIHREGLLLAAAGRRAYGETLLSPALGLPLLERLQPYALASTVVELSRWTTEWLAEALRRAGFDEVRTTVHPGELGRRFARDLISRDALETMIPMFTEATRALGTIAGSQDGRGMVTAIRR